jgi:rubredoxin
MKLPMNCPRCKRDWIYDGDKIPTKKYPQYVTCPTCHTSVKIQKKVI